MLPENVKDEVFLLNHMGYQLSEAEVIAIAEKQFRTSVLSAVRDPAGLWHIKLAPTDPPK